MLLISRRAGVLANNKLMELGQSDHISGGTGALAHFLWTAFDTTLPITRLPNVPPSCRGPRLISRRRTTS